MQIYEESIYDSFLKFRSRIRLFLHEIALAGAKQWPHVVLSTFEEDSSGSILSFIASKGPSIDLLQFPPCIYSFWVLNF